MKARIILPSLLLGVGAIPELAHSRGGANLLLDHLSAARSWSGIRRQIRVSEQGFTDVSEQELSYELSKPKPGEWILGPDSGEGKLDLSFAEGKLFVGIRPATVLESTSTRLAFRMDDSEAGWGGTSSFEILPNGRWITHSEITFKGSLRYSQVYSGITTTQLDRPRDVCTANINPWGYPSACNCIGSLTWDQTTGWCRGESLRFYSGY